MAKFNKRTVDYNLEKKKKVRGKKKAAKATEKHTVRMAACSGVRTKKHQRKVAHFARIAEKEAAVKSDLASEVEMKQAGKSRVKRVKQVAAKPVAMQE